MHRAIIWCKHVSLSCYANLIRCPRGDREFHMQEKRGKELTCTLAQRWPTGGPRLDILRLPTKSKVYFKKNRNFTTVMTYNSVFNRTSH
jgi:hypothetical protein